MLRRIALHSGRAAAKAGPRDTPQQWPALDLLKKAVEASIVVSSLLFVMGWSYLYGYYKAVGIPLSAVSPSIQDSIVHAFRVLLSGWPAGGGFLTGAGAAFLMLAYLVRHSANVGVARSFGAAVIFLAMYCGASYAASSIGAARARAQATSQTGEFPWVRMEVDPTKLGGSLVNGEDLARGDYRMVLYQPDRVWLIRGLSRDARQFSVFMIPKEAIRALSVQRSAE